MGRYFGNVFWRYNDNDVITDFLMFDFVIISLKMQNLATLCNFRSPKSKIKERWGRRASSTWRFL